MLAQVDQYVMDKPLDKNTYGGSKAAEVLVDLIGDNKSLKKKVGRMWAEYAFTMNEILGAPMKNKCRRRLIFAYYRDVEKTLDQTELPTKIKSHLKNIMTRHKRLVLNKVNKQTVLE